MTELKFQGHGEQDTLHGIIYALWENRHPYYKLITKQTSF